MNKILLLLSGLTLWAPLQAQTYSVLKNFSAPDPVYLANSDGANPKGALVSDRNVLYGTTEMGGTNAYGTVFRLNTDGTGFVVLKNFAFDDGINPMGTLVWDGAMLYGTTDGGGNAGFLSRGTAFKINTNGTGFTVLKNFGTASGSRPDAGLVLKDGLLYGTTRFGGSVDDGVVFQVNTNGAAFSVLTNFTGNRGAFPLAGLTLGSGTLYGTTSQGGGSSDYGVLYK